MALVMEKVVRVLSWYIKTSNDYDVMPISVMVARVFASIKDVISIPTWSTIDTEIVL